jgi:hypothetical protein
VNKRPTGIAGRTLLLTGIHRSGTTWIGRVLSKIQELTVLHEPFNKDYGLQGLPQWYPFIDSSVPGQEGYMKNIIADYFSGKGQYTRQYDAGISLRSVARRIFGSTAERNYRSACRARKQKVLLKDPFCLFMAPYLIEEYGVPTVVVVRHPAAHLASMKRMNWTQDLQRIFEHRLLREEYANDFPWTELRNETSEAKTNSYFWLAAHRFIMDAGEKHPSKLRITRHEDMTLHPRAELKRLLNFWGIEDQGHKALTYAMESTRGSTVAPRSGKLHEFSRDGRRLVDYWRNTLSKDEISTVSRIVEPIYDSLYPDVPW